MKASIIVLSWNGASYLPNCLRALFAQDYEGFEVIVVDNGSTDGSADLVAGQFPQVHLIRNAQTLGFAVGNNIGLRAASGDVLVLLNQDTEVHPGWLKSLVEVVQDDSVGIVGCKLLYPDGTIQHAGACLEGARGESIHIGRGEPDEGQYDQCADVDFVTGAALALTRQALTRIGFLDEGFAPVYYEDVDWCYRARKAGLRVVYAPQAVVTHHESTSVRIQSYAHKAVYHYGRLRLLFKHRALDWLAKQFLPAETRWVGRMTRNIEMMAARDAYVHLMLTLPEIFMFRLQAQNTSQEGMESWEALLGLVTRLRDTCMPDTEQDPLYALLKQTEAQAVGHALHAGLQPIEKNELSLGAGDVATESSPMLEVDERSEAVASESDAGDLWCTLHTFWEIKEQPFHSDTPLIGEGIVAFRRAWNNVATRWYVLPLLRQQISFNMAVTNLLTGTAAAQAEGLRVIRELLAKQALDVAQNMREIDRLTRVVADLQKQVQMFEKISAHTQGGHKGGE